LIVSSDNLHLMPSMSCRVDRMVRMGSRPLDRQMQIYASVYGLNKYHEFTLFGTPHHMAVTLDWEKFNLVYWADDDPWRLWHQLMTRENMKPGVAELLSHFPPNKNYLNTMRVTRLYCIFGDGDIICDHLGVIISRRL